MKRRIKKEGRKRDKPSITSHENEMCHKIITVPSIIIITDIVNIVS